MCLLVLREVLLRLLVDEVLFEGVDLLHQPSLEG